MKENEKKLIGLFGLCVVLIIGIYALYYQLAHPDLTKTRVTLNLWYLFPPAAVGMGLAMKFLSSK